MVKIKILKCRIQDLEAVVSFYNSVVLNLMNNINFPKWEYGVYPSAESVRKAIDKDTQFMCIENNEILGSFVLNGDPQGNYDCGDWENNLKNGEYLVIHTLATNPNLHNRGIGKFMVKYCIDYAKDNGYKAIRLDVVPENIPAKRLYESLSFKFAGKKDLCRGIKEIPVFDLYEINF